MRWRNAILGRGRDSVTSDKDVGDVMVCRQRDRNEPIASNFQKDVNDNAKKKKRADQYKRGGMYNRHPVINRGRP